MYGDLYELVWSGDVAEVKNRTLHRWGPDNINEPLKVSAYDSQFDNTLINVALYQKRFDLARMVLQIAKAQYRAPENVKYFVARDHDSDDSNQESDGSEFFIDSQQVDIYELGDVTHIPDQARSEISPLKLLRHQVKIADLIDNNMREKLKKLNVESGTALTIALIEDDFELFVKLLDLANEFDPGMSCFFKLT
jgi:hypothetical protein